jgi:hypothetical protein
MLVLFTKWTPVAATPAKSTVLPAVKPDPVMVTPVDPVVGPVSGLTSLTVTAGAAPL